MTIKNCPFCGDKPNFERCMYDDGSLSNGYRIECNNCSVTWHYTFKSKLEAIEHWNSRSEL